jgi:hypothetical protein
MKPNFLALAKEMKNFIEQEYRMISIRNRELKLNLSEEQMCKMAKEAGDEHIRSLLTKLKEKGRVSFYTK